MKKTFKFFAAALAIVAAASCAKEINVDTPVDTPVDNSAEKVYMTFTASYDAEGETKTVLADGNKVHWSDTDAIRIFGKKKNDSYGFYLSDESYAIDPSSNDVDPTFAVFSGTGVPYLKNYAVLPAEGWEAYSTNMRFSNGLSSQVAVKGSFDPSKHIAVSSETMDTHFSFYNGCALLKVKVGSDGIYSIKVDGAESNSNAGIGMTFQFTTPGNVESLAMKYMYGYNPSITLSNSDSSKALESGATYYIVVPYATFNNFKVAICDANGEEIISKSKASAFKIERNKVYDLGTFEKPNESIEVSATSLSVSAANGSASFKVVANANWTVSSTADWLSFSPSTGGATTGTTVTVTAMENTSDAARTATITVKGAFVSKTISVTQAKAMSYRVVKQLSHATELQDGKLYVVSCMKDTQMYWSEQDLYLKLKYYSGRYASDNKYAANEVFKFHMQSSAAGISGYKTTIVGRWESVATNKYMSNNPAMNATSSTATDIAIGQYDGSSKDFDMYIQTTSGDANKTIYYDGTRVNQSTVSTIDGAGNQKARKWYIYEVEYK